MNAYRGRDNDPNKTDRYGKKYSWIAYFELAGYLQDQGLPKERYLYNDGRISDADIDPSFPAKPPDYQLVQDDFLGNRSVNTQEWIRDGGVPSLEPYLIADKLFDQVGPWLLLDGYINQEDRDYDRNRFTFIRSLLVPANEAEEITQRLINQNLGNRWLPEKPDSHYIYAGEISWYDVWPENEWDELEFVLKTDTIITPERKLVLLREGEPLSDGETLTFLKQIRNIIDQDDLQAFDLALQEHGLEATIETVEREEVKQETKKFQVLVPVRVYHWESYHSIVNPPQSVTVLARQLMKSLKLCGQPQTFDLFSTDGRRASIVFEHEQKNRQDFIYLRQDLLSEYLETNRLKLIWAIWGERQHSVSMMSMLGPSYRGEGEQPWQVFQKIVTYDMKNYLVESKPNNSFKI